MIEKDAALRWPDELLSDVMWRYWEEAPYPSQSALVDAVERWNSRDADAAPFRWDSDAVLLRAPRVRVTYFGLTNPDDDEYQDLEAELVSDNGAGFTSGELFFKLHNAVVNHLNQADHCYFEGLVLAEESDSGEVPTYEMQQGS